jgi:hypothetical protein
VFLRVHNLLAEGDWRVERAEDGLVLMRRAGDDVPGEASGDLSRVMATGTDAAPGPSIGSYLNGRVSLLSAALVASPDAAVDVDGPRWILRTIWRAEQPLPDGTRIDFWLDRRDGQRQHVWDIADLWWNPPEQWAPGTPVTVDIPDVPVREFLAWQAEWSTP